MGNCQLLPSLIKETVPNLYITPLPNLAVACSGCTRRANEVQVAAALQLDCEESGVQAAALKCLVAFKHRAVMEHQERLLRWVLVHNTRIHMHVRCMDGRRSRACAGISESCVAGPSQARCSTHHIFI